MASRLFWLAAVLLASACVTRAQIERQGQEVLAACKARYDSGAYKTWLERAHCINNGLGRIHREHDYPHYDLVHLSNSYRLALARRIDKGVISEDDARQRMAVLGMRIVTEERRRRMTSGASFVPTATSRSLVQGLAAWRGPGEIVAELDATVHCWRVADTIACY